MTHCRLPNFSMTLAAVTALSKSCLLVENQHLRIAHLVLVRHLDAFFVCLLNPVSVIAVNGVDRTVCSPEALSPSRLNLVLASRAPHGETQVLVLNGLHFATDRCNGRHHFAKFQLVENRGLFCGIKLDHQNPRRRLANQALPNLSAGQTHGNQYATSCFALPDSARPRILSRTQRLCHTLKRRRTPLQSTVSRLANAPAKQPNIAATSCKVRSSASKVHEPDRDLATLLPLLLPLPPLLSLPFCCCCSVTAAC